LHAQTGLTFSSSTGMISGVPTAVRVPTNYAVTAHGSGGTANATVVVAVTYGAAPASLALSPVIGSVSGGGSVTLTGTGFQSDAQVVFGASAATVVRVAATHDTAMVLTPAHAVGSVGVKLTNGDSQSVILNNSYAYDSVPGIATPPRDTVVLSGAGARFSVA